MLLPRVSLWASALPKPGWSRNGTERHIAEAVTFHQQQFQVNVLVLSNVGQKMSDLVCGKLGWILPVLPHKIVNKEAFCSISSHTSWVLGLLVTDIRLKTHLSVQKLAWFAAPKCFEFFVPILCSLGHFVVNMCRRIGNGGKLVFYKNKIRLMLDP